MVNIRDVSLFPNTATWLFPGADCDSVPAARALSADSMVDSVGSDYPLVVIVGPRHILVWDKDRDGKLKGKPNLAGQPPN